MTDSITKYIVLSALVLVGGILLFSGLVGVIPYWSPPYVIPAPEKHYMVLSGIILLLMGFIIYIPKSTIVENTTNFQNDLAEDVANRVINVIRGDSIFLNSSSNGTHPANVSSLFKNRFSHFLPEKEYLAKNFTNHLLDRCKAYILNGKKVYLIIDSGTTLFHLFKPIGIRAVQLKDNREDWIDNLYVESNNLPGALELMRTALLDPNSRYSPLALNFNMLPGVPLPVYSALTGERTISALKQLRTEAGNDGIFISLTTGNWIRIRRTHPQSPIPLARGEGHLKFKQAILDNSDEVFVISPLGKIIVDASPGELNSVLAFNDNDPDFGKNPYEEVIIQNKKAETVKLVSSTRKPNHVLTTHSDRVEALLGMDVVDLRDILQNFSLSPIEKIGHLLFPFEKSYETWDAEYQAEFPHEHTRTDTFTQKFFHVGHEKKSVQ